MRILLVEHDKNRAQRLADILRQQHYLVDVVQNSQTASEMMQCIRYSLILMNIQSTRPDQMGLCCQSRDQSQQVPVMLITVQDFVTDSFTTGQGNRSHPLVKSLKVQELLTQIRVSSRQFHEQSALVLSCGKVRLNSATREISYDGRPIAFSRKEYLLIELLLRYPHRLFSGAEIVDRLWSFDNLPTEDTVRSHIRRIRRKLTAVGARDLIQTLYGHGYRINPIYLTEPQLNSKPAAVSVVGAVWPRQMGLLEQVASLEQAVIRLQSGVSEAGSLQFARQAAHQLAETADDEGFAAVAHIARAIAVLLQPQLLQPSIIHSLTQLMNALRFQLDPQFSEAAS